jgi:hypothetical protein
LDIDSWLRGIGLAQYAEMFRANDIDGELLDRLTSDDLKEIGVASFGHRRKLLEALSHGDVLRSGRLDRDCRDRRIRQCTCSGDARHASADPGRGGAAADLSRGNRWRRRVAYRAD